MYKMQEQNEQLSKKLAARPVMAPGLERTLLEAHLRLLLGKLGVTSGAGLGKGGLAATAPGSGGVSGGEQPHTFRDSHLGRGKPGSTRVCCAPAEGCVSFKGLLCCFYCVLAVDTLHRRGQAAVTLVARTRHFAVPKWA